MIIHSHGSLGDQIMLTGIPEAYYNLFGEKSYIDGGRTEIWENNPFTTTERVGKDFNYGFNAYPKDYMIYYPIRIFYDLTGYISNRDFVHPNLYKSFNRDHICVVNDQAGWPSRVNYVYFEELVQQIKSLGYVITYIRNDNFRDCCGNCPTQQIFTYDHILKDIPLKNLIEVIGSCELYIGYNSGPAQIAGALNTPYIQFDGPIPPINTVHNSCILAPNITHCRRCIMEQCENHCLARLENINDFIIQTIKDVIL